MSNKLLEILGKLEEPELIDRVLYPLLEIIHPGRLEFTHSNNEAGRDIISYGKSIIGRDDILCVQAKANNVSYGAQFNTKVVHPAELAKEEGVTLQNGTKTFPNEVWFITSTPFPSNKRLLVADTLKKLESKNIKFIPGEELCQLIVDKMPDLATQLLEFNNNNIVSIISEFSKHSDGIAFSLDPQKNINEFYIITALTPYTQWCSIGLDENTTMDDSILSYHEKLSDILLDSEMILEKEIEKTILSIVKERIQAERFYKNNNVKFSIELNGLALKDTDNTNDITFDYFKGKSELKKITQNTTVNFTLKTKLRSHFTALKKKTDTAIKTCPKTLSKSPVSIIKTCQAIKTFEDFISDVIKYYPKEAKGFSDIQGEKIDTIISVPKPEYLILLNNYLLIEGLPGCGKTTLLKKLYIALLETNQKALYIPCCTISTSSSSILGDIVKSCSIGGFSEEFKEKAEIIILDGLDEAPFDLTSTIFEGQNIYKKIIISARSSYITELRKRFFNIVLAPFSVEDRNTFFQKMLPSNKRMFEKALQLFKEYPDIDEHTKLPLVAAITVSLMKNEITPTTRSEIYNQRLDLLLSRWDHARNVSRIKIENPKAKLRFLKHLAYKIHSSKKRMRQFNIEVIEQAFGSLGDWGYRSNFDDFLHDLVKCNGILIKISDQLYTFGHLSFQEHLVGEYLYAHKNDKEIRDYLGKDWWREPLNFWASRKECIDEFLNIMLDEPCYRKFRSQLIEMVKYAPFTEPGAKDMLFEDENERL